LTRLALVTGQVFVDFVVSYEHTAFRLETRERYNELEDPVQGVCRVGVELPSGAGSAWPPAPGGAAEDIDEAVAARMQRQQILYRFFDRLAEVARYGPEARALITRALADLMATS
jgi:hypothetical protein